MIAIAPPPRASQSTEVVRNSVSHAGLLAKAARTGDRDIWATIVEVLKGRGLLQEVRARSTAGGPLLPRQPDVVLVCFKGDMVLCIWTRDGTVSVYGSIRLALATTISMAVQGGRLMGLVLGASAAVRLQRPVSRSCEASIP